MKDEMTIDVLPMEARFGPGSEERVILSEAKDPLAWIERREMILRFAQDDVRCLGAGTNSSFTLHPSFLILHPSSFAPHPSP